jgi:hypothetical protein
MRARRPGSPGELCAEFAEAVRAQARCICQGDARTGNRHARIYIAAARELLTGGDAALDEFARLLSDPSDDVRVAAAAYLLRDRTELAVSTLRPIAKKQGIVALGAQETLKRYARGELDIK